MTCSEIKMICLLNLSVTERRQSNSLDLDENKVKMKSIMRV